MEGKKDSISSLILILKLPVTSISNNEKKEANALWIKKSKGLSSWRGGAVRVAKAPGEKDGI